MALSAALSPTTRATLPIPHQSLVASHSAPRLCTRIKAGGEGCNSESTPAVGLSASRRAALFASAAVVALPSAGGAQAIGFKKEMKKKKLLAEDYTPLDDQLKIYELDPGYGDPIKPDDVVLLHFDCYFRGIDVVSSRSARLLGGNRTLAEPIEVLAGGKLARISNKASYEERSGGLFTSAGGPKPPPALPNAILGMKVGGKRSILVPAELAYGAKGELEIPPNTDIEMQVEILERRSK